MFLRAPRTPADCIMNIPEKVDISITDPNTYAEKKAEELTECYKACIDNMMTRNSRNKKNRDSKIRSENTLKPGDRVVVYKNIKINKIDDNWDASLHEVIKPKTQDSNIYLVKELKSEVVKEVHRERLLKIYEAQDGGSVDVASIASWYDLRYHRQTGKPKEVVNDYLNRKIAVHYGTMDSIQNSATLQLTDLETRKSIVEKLKMLRKKEQYTVVIFLRHQQNSVSLLENLLRALRSELQAAKKWQTIVICTEDKSVNNKLLQLMQIYFPKQPVNITEDDSSDDEQLIVKMRHEDAGTDSNTNEEDTTDPESTESDTDLEESTTDSESGNTTDETDSSEPHLGRGKRVRKQTVFYDNPIPH